MHPGLTAGALGLHCRQLLPLCVCAPLSQRVSAREMEGCQSAWKRALLARPFPRGGAGDAFRAENKILFRNGELSLLWSVVAARCRWGLVMVGQGSLRANADAW
jgi:hypothetical protein